MQCAHQCGEIGNTCLVVHTSRSFADIFQPNLHLCIRKKPQILGENIQLIAVS